jgi:glycosyltransferase involved in cell wall biosynthesis
VRVAIFTQFPRQLDRPRGGVETVSVALVQALQAFDDVDVHVIAFERGLRSVEVSEAVGATVHRLPGSRWPQMFDVLFGPGRRRLRRYLIKLDPDVVHLHETYALGIGQLPMPQVFTVHGFDHANIPAERSGLASLRSPIWRRIESRGLARHGHIISITPYVREYVAPLTNATIYDIDNPINPAFFDTPRAEVPGRVFFAGWISHRKNALGLVEAFAKVIRRGVDASLHLAGEESDVAYGQRVRRAIEDLGIRDRAELLGRINSDAIRQELSQACLFVLPARQENAPMAISEAMAAGVPVASSNVCGMPYMIEEGKTGYLVDPEDCDGLADRIERLLTDVELRSAMGAAARRAAEERFHPDAVARRTVAVYRKIIDSAKTQDAPAPRVNGLS